MSWSGYSHFVGDVFGAPPAMEGLAAFFLESVFLGLWLFGWNLVGAERDGGRRNGQDLPRAEPVNSYRGGVRFAAWVLSWAAALVIALLRGRGGRSGGSRAASGPRPAAQR